MPRSSDDRPRAQEYEVLWAGRGSIPGMSADGWTYRGNYLIDVAPGSTDWITCAESDAMKPGDNRPCRMGCGRYAEPKRWKCQQCRKNARREDTKAFNGKCRSCGDQVKPADMRLGCRRCRACRGKTDVRGPYQRKAA